MNAKHFWRNWATGLILFSMTLSMIVLSSVAEGQPEEARQLRQSAKEARENAAKQREYGDTESKTADMWSSLADQTRKAAEERRKAGDAVGAAGKEEAARGYEQRAEEALIRAAKYYREATALLNEAHDKEEEANRILHNAPPDSLAIIMHERTADLLRRVNLEMARLRANAGSKLGTEYDTGTKKYTVFGQKQFDDIFANPTADLKEISVSLDKRWAAIQAKKAKIADLSQDYFGMADSAINIVITAEFNVAVLQVRVLEVECGRADDKESEIYSNMTKAIDASYQGGAITFDEKNAKLEALKKEVGEHKHQTFDQVAVPYRALMIRLARFRKEWSNEMKSWHDFAAKHNTAVIGVFSYWAQQFEKENYQRFSDKADPSIVINVTNYAFVPGSPDRLNTYCTGLYPPANVSWCKAGLYPDIQDPETPSEFRMWHLVDVKLEDSVTTNKIDGAAATEKP